MENKIRKIFTLCIIQRDSNLLLGMKKRGFGNGRWNGFGGKPKDSESIEETAKREIYEESGIVANNIERVGVNDFEFLGNPEIMEVHIFRCQDFDGEPKETEEMKPQWFGPSEIPFDSMWPDDKHWFPLFLNNKKFRGKFLFEGFDKIVEMDLKEVNEDFE